MNLTVKILKASPPSPILTTFHAHLSHLDLMAYIELILNSEIHNFEDLYTPHSHPPCIQIRTRIRI